MTQGTAVPPPARRQEMLAMACARNVVAEVELCVADGPSRSGHAKLLRAHRDEVLIEMPRIDGLAAALRAETRVVVHFGHNGQQFSFKSRIQGTRRMQATGAGGLLALSLSYPKEIAHRQRRQHFRLSIIADRVPCILAVLSDDNGEAGSPTYTGADQAAEPAVPAAAKGLRLQGVISDISVGGMLALLDADVTTACRSGMQVLVAFVLPPPGGRFALVAEVRFVRPADRRGQMAVGLQFQAQANGAPLGQAADCLDQYVVQEQRRRKNWG